MSVSISLLRRIPPSLRRASLARMPGPTIPVGWNWTASGSITGKPALRINASPSPVLLRQFVVIRNTCPEPPVARTVALASTVTNSPSLILNRMAPTQQPSLKRSSVTTVELMKREPPLSASPQVVSIIPLPVRSATNTARKASPLPHSTVWPPNCRLLCFPSSSRLQCIPLRSSHWTSSQPPSTIFLPTSWSEVQSPPFQVSNIWYSDRSVLSLGSTAAIPPWAVLVWD